MKINLFIFLGTSILIISCGQSTGLAPTDGGCSPCKIFLSATSDSGGASVAGLDSLCTNDSNNPHDGYKYKALVASASRNPGTSDWPLQALTTYVQSNGTTVIGTTNSSSVFTFPLSNPVSTSASNVWAGFSSSMSVSAFTCADWTSSSLGSVGMVAISSLTSTGAFSFSTNTCDNPYKFYCVQQ